MSDEAKKARPARRKWWVRRWHRWIGMIFALPLLWLAVSGLALRHAEGLGLHEAKVGWRWVLKEYGMIPEGTARGAEVGTRLVGEWDENLFLDGALLEESGVLVGAVAKGRDVVVATEDYLLVYDPGGMLVDQLGEESLPVTPVEAIGTDAAGAVMLRGGGKLWRIADDFLEYGEVAGAEVGWSAVADLDESRRAELESRLVDQAGVSWHRVLLDMHSGNLFGAVSKWAVDIVAIGIIVLTLMGVRIVFRKSRMNGAGSGGGHGQGEA